jgi:hypothetical protein
MKTRVVTAEILDGLPESDPAAARSRRDLRRIHRVMGTAGLIARTLRATPSIGRGSAPVRILELGAGDGHLMLNVARRVYAQWPNVELTLLDRLDLVDGSTRMAYSALGWRVRPLVVDVLDWTAGKPAPSRALTGGSRWDLIIANLFLHHFDSVQLSALLSVIAARGQCFVANEPRRSWLARAGSRLVGAIGANAVTRTDAVLSVAAGFRDSEMSALWPVGSGSWKLTERATGLFGQQLLAERTAGHPDAAVI